jgi:hypothetical protein
MVARLSRQRRTSGRCSRRTLAAPKSAAWNVVKIPATSVTTGTSYWIALLGTGGTLKFRDRCCGSGSAVETSSLSNLTTLPGSWTTGGLFKDGPVSAYVAGSGVALPPADQIGRWAATSRGRSSPCT